MEETKQCPYCGKTILAVANKCKHCNQWIEGVEMEICPVCHELIPRNQDICPYCKEDIKKFLVESRKKTDSIRVLDKKQAESHDDSNKTSNYHLFKNDSPTTRITSNSIDSNAWFLEYFFSMKSL